VGLPAGSGVAVEFESKVEIRLPGYLWMSQNCPKISSQVRFPFIFCC